MIEKIDLVIESQKEMRTDVKSIESDVKMILQKLPTYQTKEDCTLNHKDITDNKKGMGKFIITTTIASLFGLGGLIIGIINIIKIIP